MKVVLVFSILLLYPGYNRPTDLCSEGTLIAALVTAQPGGTVILDCTGAIKISHTIVISNNLSIEGAGPSVTLSGDVSWPIFKIEGGADVTLKRLTLLNGGLENHGRLTVSMSR